MPWHASIEMPLAYCSRMREILCALLLAVALVSCGSYNGGSTPAGGGAATAAPQASGAAQTPMPSGNPDVDNYGY